MNSHISKEFDLVPADNVRLANLCGPLDEHLRQVEQGLGVEIRRRGSHFSLMGSSDATGAAEEVLRGLFATAEKREITPQHIHLVVRERGMHGPEDGAMVVTGGERVREQNAPVLRSEFSDGDALIGGGHGPDRDETKVRTLRGGIQARGPNQKEYLAYIRKHDLTFGIGPAGTGKTYLAVACAVEALQADRVRRIVLVRPAVEAGERLGFLPGDMAQKIDPYLRPMYDALYEMLGFDRVARFIERSVIEVAPLAFMRGRSLNDSFVILDEAQNTTPEQMKMFLTRIGFGSKAVVTGDITQTDLPMGRASGLKQVIDILNGVDGVAFTFFNARDVVRHPLVQRIVQAYEQKTQN